MADEDVLAELLSAVGARLTDADTELAERYPGDRGVRQPLHTVYVPADVCTAEVIDTWSRDALGALETHGADALLRALDLPAPSDDLVPRVARKLTEQPIEDLRIDFEDGYRSAAEDEDASAAVGVIRAISQLPTGPAHIGIRFKSLEAQTRERGLRTLDLVVRGLATTGGLPDGFVVTLPKVTSVDQVEAMVEVCDVLERAYRLGPGALLFELQIETPQSVLGADGRATVAPMIHAAAGRCTGLHYGTYDYAAAAGIAPAYQSMEHPVADHAKTTMHVAVAGTGVLMSDGSTNVLPVGSTDQVRAAWALHARLVLRSLERGIYQGWDLHPAQLVTRYAAVYGFMDEGLPTAIRRLTDYLSDTASGVMDEPATAKALAQFILRAYDCGAATAASLAAAGAPDIATLARLARRPVGPPAS